MQGEIQRPSTIRLAFKPLRDMFVFSGRSRRSEVLAFYLLWMLANAALVLINDNTLLGHTAQLIWGILWTVPELALFARRLHDSGRSGRYAFALFGAMFSCWLALSLYLSAHPDAGYSISGLSVHLHNVRWTPLLALMMILYPLTILALWVVALMPPTDGPNLYGPDPRRSSGQPAPAAG